MPPRRNESRLTSLLRGFVNVLTGGAAVVDEQLQGAQRRDDRRATVTTEVDPDTTAVRISYDPRVDGDPDAGEIVWTWVPFAENDGRGKDRPVLVIGRRDARRVYAVRLTSKPQDGDRDFLSIGSGAWDSAGRPSWVDIDQLYVVHAEGMRREAAILDRARFAAVADALRARYGWEIHP